MSGPLQGTKVIELAGIGPSPYACMLLADAGAQVIRLERAPAGGAPRGEGPYWDLLNRSRPSVGLDLKQPAAVGLVLDLVGQADVLIEGFRPGVAERLGVGPEDCWARNPKLVYGRMTGWGQDGPMAETAGHDINYIAISGALWPLGRADERPAPPLNLVGDFGGGGMLLAFGVLAALVEAGRSGQGPGGRRRHDRRLVVADDHDLRLPPVRVVAGGPRRRTSWTPVPTSTRSTRRPTASTSRWGPWRPSSTPSS